MSAQPKHQHAWRPLNSLGLDSKFQPPAHVSVQVLRQELRAAIAGAAGQLVLVSAPAGFGKTTAMTQARAMLEESGVPTAWLTLDRADNDLSRFISCIDEAAARLGLAAGAQRDPLTSLLRPDGAYALFLDELESVHDASVLGLLRELAMHLPRNAHLVIGSRGLPQLGLARLRVRGQLLEIDAGRLRFTPQDVTGFFAQRPRAHNLSIEQLSRLHEKTEGWVAAVWLAWMALERADDPDDFLRRFSGSERAVADYLAEEVLARQPQDVREFLLRTSVLRQLDASVCSAVNPRVDCAAMLERLQAEHLFLTPVAGTELSWRYHSLFSDYLRARLDREHPDEAARLNLAASGWYESRGRPVPAIDHAIEGGDFPHAMELLEQHAETFLSEGRMRLLARWFASFPPALLARHGRHGRLQVIAIWATCFTRGPWEAMKALEASQAQASEDTYLRAHANGIRPLLLAMQDRNEEALEVGRVALQHLPTGHHFPDTTLLNAMAHVTSVAGQSREAQQLIDAARREHSGAGTFNRMYSEANEGLIDLLQGRLRHAAARFRLAVDATHAVNFHHTHGNAYAGVFYASVVYEANDLDQADHLLNVYLPLARDVGLPDHVIHSHAMRSRIAFIGGDVDAAMLTLSDLEYLGIQRKLPRVIAAAKLERARLLLLQGHAAAARDELLRADDATLWARERRQRLLAHDVHYMALARLRWEITFGDPAAALASLDAEIHAATASGRLRRQLALQLLRTLALHRSGNAPAAMAQMAPAMQFAAQEGFVRLVLDEGPALGMLVQRYRAMHEASAQRDPIVGEYLQRLLAAFGPLPSDNDSSPDLAAGLLEPLTKKEVGVLKLLAEGYSNTAIAEKLFVSESTVRTHLRNINAKLGAHSRTQAVAIARRLGVVS
jgi:LuxR family maltose regulon positive regulatory protein